MWLELLAVAGGFILLAWSADRLVTGASALAYDLNVSPLIIGLTILSFGTSAPEILVSAVASWKGNPGLAVGNALGSNIINTTLILGTAALITPLSVHSGILRRELPALVFVMVVVLVLLLDGWLGRLDGALLLTGMVLMLLWVLRLGIRAQTRRDPLEQEYADEVPTGMGMSQATAWIVVGAVLLLLSSKMLVWGAVAIAQTIGVSDLVIGLTIVALGTSLPELAATVVSALKGEDDMAIGNILGSNIFNLLAVLGLPGLIAPLAIDHTVLTRDYAALSGITLMLFIMAYGFRGPGRINRLEGATLVVAFGAYQTLLYFSEVT